MTGRVTQLLALALLFVAAVAVSVVRTRTSDSATSDAVSTRELISQVEVVERDLQFQQAPQDACAAIYLRYFSDESSGFFNSVCSYSGLVAFKLGNIDAISTANPISMASGSGLTSGLSITAGQFGVDLDSLGYGELQSFCQCKALQIGCRSATVCGGTTTADGGRALHTANLVELQSSLRTGTTSTTTINNPYQAQVLLDYARRYPQERCLSLC
jgi:hypothetical protein